MLQKQVSQANNYKRNSVTKKSLCHNLIINYNEIGELPVSKEKVKELLAEKMDRWEYHLEKDSKELKI